MELGILKLEAFISPALCIPNTDKKENKIFFLIYVYKEIQNGAVAKSYMTNGLSYTEKYLRISSYLIGSPSSYMTSQLLHSEFSYIWGKFDFLFISVWFLTLHDFNQSDQSFQ